MSGASKTRLQKKFVESELYDITRDLEDCIAELELLRGDLWKLGFIIDDVEMMTHIISNLPEGYENIVENLEEELYDDIGMLTNKIFWDKLSYKYNRMNAQSNQSEAK